VAALQRPSDKAAQRIHVDGKFAVRECALELDADKAVAEQMEAFLRKRHLLDDGSAEPELGSKRISITCWRSRKASTRATIVCKSCASSRWNESDVQASAF
jgi:hypothetical protein